jgi:hypothetical protein
LNTRLGNSGASALTRPCVSLRFLDPVQVTGSTGGIVTNVSSTIKKVCLTGTLNPGQSASVIINGTYSNQFSGFDDPFCNVSVP